MIDERASLEMSSKLPRDGFQVLPGALDLEQCSRHRQQIDHLLRRDSGAAIGSKSNRIVGGRNLQLHWSGWREVVQTESVRQTLKSDLGDRFGLVRILYFDKPPGQTWHLALHRDGAIAVAEHHQPPAPYSQPNRKAGVPHVQADDSLLERMLTLRVHLDRMHADNGPLVVVPGSHRSRTRTSTEETTEIHCAEGDVFAMKPLLLHGSRSSAENCLDHRRVVHLEFAPQDALAHPYRWFRYDDVFVDFSTPC